MNANQIEVKDAYKDGLSDGNCGIPNRNAYLGEAAAAYERGFKDGMTNLCGEQD